MREKEAVEPLHKEGGGARGNSTTGTHQQQILPEGGAYGIVILREKDFCR